MLGAATAFDVFTLLSVFTLSVMTCCSLCCPKNLGHSPPATADAVPSSPTVVIASTAQIQGYPQPYSAQGGYPPQQVYSSQTYPQGYSQGYLNGGTQAGAVEMVPQLVYASAVPADVTGEKAAASGGGIVGKSGV